MTTRRQGQAASALRSIKPQDIAAWESLGASDPGMLERLVAGVVAACAKPSPGLDMAEVSGLAVVSVARQYAACGKPAYAVARAVRMARIDVADARIMHADIDSDEVAVRLEHWEQKADSGPAARGQVDSIGALVWDAVATMPSGERENFRTMAHAYMGHDRASCERCSVPGSRVARVSVSSVLAHVGGHASNSAVGTRLRKSSGTALAAAEMVLLPVVNRHDGKHAPCQIPVGDRLAWGRSAGGAQTPRVNPGMPDIETVTVTRSGVTTRRGMTESELSAMIREPETAIVDGETIRVVRESFAGELHHGDDRAATSPVPGINRRSCTCKGACPDEGHSLGELQALAYPTVVSPRKRAGSGSTGPTVTIKLR